jgi:cholesterol transport system auxiliary component
MLAFAIAGCGLTRPATVKQTYLLQTPPPLQNPGTPRATTLRIGAINVATPFRGKSLVYREGELKYESDFYNEFFVAPAAMFTESAGTWLATAGLFKAVLPAGTNADGDYVLEGFVGELYGDYRAGNRAAVLSAKFFLIDASVLSGVPVWETEIRERVPLSSDAPDALAAGINAAWAATLNDLARAIAQAKLPR